MHKTVTVGTAAMLSFALAACGSASRQESSASDANAVTASEVGSIDNTGGMPANDASMTMAQPAAEFADLAVQSDLFEITSSRIAQTQAKNAEVKAFAAMLVQDHTKSTAELKSIASKENIALNSATLTPDVQSKIEALKAAKGEQFDTLYMTQQVPAHEMALKLHQGYAQSGDTPSLKAFASKTAPIVSKHLDEARTMSKR